LVKAGADARQERRWHLDVGRGVKARINRRKERLFFSKGTAARGTGSEVRAQFPLRLGTGGGGFD
jgi:hypothetical protein